MNHTFGLKILILFLHYEGIRSSNLENELLPQVGTKIVGGQPIEISQAKYQVSVRRKAWEKQYGYGHGHTGGGSVVSQRLIITAGHIVLMCGPGIKCHPSDFTVVMGTKYRFRSDRNTLQYDVQEIIVHPNYFRLQNDIAALFINGYIPWNWKTVTAIPLNRLMLAKDTPCLVTGWGDMSYNVTKQTAILQAANVPIVDFSTCQKAYDHISIDMLCAGDMEGNISPCQGDSGGPLMCVGVLAGVVSWGKECGKPLFPGVYNNISYSYGWIRAVNASFNYAHYGDGDHSADVGIGKRSRLAGYSSLLLMLFFSALKKVLKKFTYLCTGIVQ